jgi:hypothetical protein
MLASSEKRRPRCCRPTRSGAARIRSYDTLHLRRRARAPAVGICFVDPERSEWACSGTCESRAAGAGAPGGAGVRRDPSTHVS